MKPIITNGPIRLLSELKIFTSRPEVLDLYMLIDSLRFCESALFIGTIVLTVGINIPSARAIIVAYWLGTGETS